MPVTLSFRCSRFPPFKLSYFLLFVFFCLPCFEREQLLCVFLPSRTTRTKEPADDANCCRLSIFFFYCMIFLSVRRQRQLPHYNNPQRGHTLRRCAFDLSRSCFHVGRTKPSSASHGWMDGMTYFNGASSTGSHKKTDEDGSGPSCTKHTLSPSMSA